MNEAWVTELYNRNAPKLLRYLYSHTNNMSDAEDILQDTFVSIFKHAENFDPERCNEEAWIYIIAKRKLISYYRAKKDQTSLDEMEDFQLLELSEEAEASRLMERRELVAEALATLDERSREVVVLTYFDDLDDGAIAERIGVSEGNVRVIRSRALMKMRSAALD